MSQFNSLFKTNDESKTETKAKTKTAKKKSVAAASLPSASSSPTTPSAVNQSPPTKAVKRRGTAGGGGKSSNSDYTQVLSYLRRDTHNRVKAALIFDEAQRDLSDLIEELLSGWLKKNSR